MTSCDLWPPGAFVPLTVEGTIVVDGVLASCYASFDHDWAHLLTTPFRWLPWLFESEADREADGPRGRTGTPHARLVRYDMSFNSGVGIHSLLSERVAD